jgi:hypothetical protein
MKRCKSHEITLRIDTGHLPHPVGKIPFQGFNQKIIVIVHQTAGMTVPIETPDNLTEYFSKTARDRCRQ